MSDPGRTPSTRRERRAAERAAGRSPAVAAASTPIWRSPVALLSLAVLVVGLVIVAAVAVGTGAGGRDPVRTPPAVVPDGLRDGRSLGAPDAPVRIELWEDPQCPVCGRFVRELEPLLIAAYVADGSVRVDHRDFVFLGQESLDAAVGMRAAEQLAGRFWDFNAIVYENQDGENQGAFSRDRLADMAVAIGLERDAFLALLDDEALISAVSEETLAGRNLGIRSTPTLVIDGEIRPGLPTWDDLSAVIDGLLADAAASAAP